MSVYRKKYILEFDDVQQGSFNDYKLELWKKSPTSTTNNVTVGAINISGEDISANDPVRVVAGEVVKSKASVASSMPSTGIATVSIPNGTTTSNGILTHGVLEHTFAPTSDLDYYVAQNGGVTDVTTGLSIVQKVGVQVSNNAFFLLINEQEVDLIGSNSPVILNYNVTEDNIFAPIRSSYLDINIYHTVDMSADQFYDLYITEDDGFKVFLYKNTNLFWNGWLGSSLVSEEQISSPFLVQLRAYDGLHLLEKTPFFDTSEVFRATSNQFNDRFGYVQIRDIIGKCLFNTGLLTQVDNDIFSVIKITNDNDTATTYDDDYFLTDTKIHHTSFMNGESDGQTCFTVLKNVLTALGATIYQRDGSWCIVRIADISLFDKNSPPTCRRDYNWANATSPTSINKTTTNVLRNRPSSNYTEDTTFFQIDGASTMTFQYPLKRVVVKQDNDHNFITTNHLDSVVDLGASDPSGTLLFAEWEVNQSDGSADIQEAVVLRDIKYISSNPTLASKAEIKNNLPKVLIEADKGTNSVRWRSSEPNLKYPVSHSILCKQIEWEQIVDPTASPLEYNYATKSFVFEFMIRVLSVNPPPTDDVIYVPIILRAKATNTTGVGNYDLVTTNVNTLNENSAFFVAKFNDASEPDATMSRPFVQSTEKVNEWVKVKIHVGEQFVGSQMTSSSGLAESMELEVHIYGGFVRSSTSSAGDTFTDVKDVTFAEMKAMPTATKWKIQPEKQEYIIEQSANYSRVEDYDVKLGANVCTAGANCFIGYENGTNTAILSFNNWGIKNKTGNTLQHIVALGHMLLYRIPIRRIDGTHYGNYKYGNRMVYDSGVNGSTGKFFPMGVKMDLRNARVDFTGDDLMDNSSYNMNDIERKIKWMGEDNISETIDYA